MLWKCITLFFVIVSVRQGSINIAATLYSYGVVCCSCGSDLVCGTWESLRGRLCRKLSGPFVNDRSPQWLSGPEWGPPEFDWTSQLNNTVLTVLRQKNSVCYVLATLFVFRNVINCGNHILYQWFLTSSTSTVARGTWKDCGVATKEEYK